MLTEAPAGSTPPGELTIRSDAAAFDDPEIRAFWDDAIASSDPRTVFRSREWIATWWRHFGASGSLRLVLARDARRQLLGVLPCYERRERNNAGLRWRRWRLLGSGLVGSDYLGLVTRPEDCAGAAALLARGFASEAIAGPDVIDLEDLLPGDPLSVSCLGVPALDLRERPRFLCPFVTTTGRFADYLAQRPHQIVTQFTRRRRWLERNAGLRFESVGPGAAPDQIRQAMDELLRLHRSRWEHRDDANGIDGIRVERFHREAAERLAGRGWLRIYLLRAHQEIVAALYGVERDRVFFFYQSGFDAAWATRSVGTVLLGILLEDCFERRLTEFDFLRGDEAYKLQWATGMRETRALRLIAQRPQARLAARADEAMRLARRRVGRVLPEWARRQWLRRKRRLRQRGGVD